MPKKSDFLGILSVLPSGAGFLRLKDNMYLPGSDDIFVDKRLIQQHHLRFGDEIYGEIGDLPHNEKSAPLTNITKINGKPLKSIKDRPRFNELTVIHPNQQLILDCKLKRFGRPDYTNRIIDILCPFGKGQRALIVSPPKAGKTMVLQAVAEGIAKNHPECIIFILLVDERPEEVSDMIACGYGEVISSSFDNPPKRHTMVSEMTLARARRQVEMGKDVVIILDSITRMARAYNTLDLNSGSKTLSGGLGSAALDTPKKFLGSARNIENGGSLTIIATALIDTGSRMDQVIFEEFKGTGNSELVLSRDISNRRIFPAFDLNSSATRREENLLSPDAYQASNALRRILSDANPFDAMTSLIDAMSKTTSNKEFIKSVVSRHK